MTSSKKSWIKAGYQIFALHGEAGLKVELLAEKTGISKSSFYHHFAIPEIFVSELLNHHLEQSLVISVKERSAKNIDPELINILTEHKTDLLFNRQLRFNQNKENFNNTVLKSDEIIGKGFINLWANELNNVFSEQQLSTFVEMALKSFYLQINEKNINYKWLSSYFEELKETAKLFR